jgi:hypothetical protein
MIETSHTVAINIINTCVNITFNSEVSKLNVTLKWKEMNVTLLIYCKTKCYFLLLLLKVTD